MSGKTDKSSIHLIFFYMQSKELFKLTQPLCRLAKDECDRNKGELPDDVRDDISYDKILELIECIEKLEYTNAMEILSEAYKEYQEMLSYLPRQSSRNGVSTVGLQWLITKTRLFKYIENYTSKT